jgi:CheY-like chemotaxis protein
MLTRSSSSEKPVDVLVVDDDKDAANELAEYLSKSGLTCVEAQDGWAALKLVADGYRPKAVVSDLGMPELDGLQFAEHLSRLRLEEKPEIIFVAGNPDYDDAVEAIRLGARDMLVKPVDCARLVRSVKSALVVWQLRRGAPRDLPMKGDRSQELRSDGERGILDDLRAVRKIRAKYFPSELFSDPCWEMLLDLYDGRLAAQQITVTSLGAASGVPLTTAWRRMDALERHGLIERKQDPADKRRILICLTTSGLEAVRNFLETYSRRLPGYNP